MFLSRRPTQADAQVEARLRRIERKLDLLLQHLGIPVDEVGGPGRPSAAVRALADEGRKIEAIKAYRTETGAGLAEAKEAVEAYLRGA